MTEDRAISLNAVIKAVDEHINDDGTLDDDISCILEDLPPVTPCEDAISRDAVIKLAYDMSEIDGEHFGEPCMVVDVEDIQKLPPVTPQRTTGHWISTLATALTTNDIALNGVACSECGKVTYITNRTPICCPWCDTDMRGDDSG